MSRNTTCHSSGLTPQVRQSPDDKKRLEAHMEKSAEIGASVVIKGELTAREDIVIGGRIEGSVRIDGHSVTINAGAQVVADVDARTVVVGGQVVGAVCAADRIELRQTADVEGELEAPAIRIVEGA